MHHDDLQQRFTVLMHGCQQPLRAFVLAVTRDDGLCDDIIQDASLVLWRRFADFDAARPFLPWARGVTRNCILKEYERRRLAPPALSPEALDCIARSETRVDAPAQDRLQALRRCLQELTARSRQLLTLRYQSALGIEDLAQAVGSNVAAVKKGLYRSRAQMVACVRSHLARSGGA